MKVDERIIRDMITHRIDLMRLESGVRDDVVHQLEKMRDEVNKAVRSRDLSTLQRRELNNLQSDIDAILKRSYSALLRDWEEAQTDLIEAESEHWYLWANGLADDYSLPKPKRLSDTAKAGIAATLMIAGFTLSEALAKQYGDISYRVKGAVRMSWADSLLGEWQFPDISAMFKKQADHTALLAAFWIDRVESEVLYQAERLNPLFKGWRHLAVLDSRTSAPCLSRHNLMWNKDLEPIDHDLPFAKPPLHFNCRSMLVPFVDGDEVRNISGDDWVKDRTLPQLQEQFGKSIGQMLHDGEITLSDAVKSGGLKPRTLKEIKKL